MPAPDLHHGIVRANPVNDRRQDCTTPTQMLGACSEIELKDMLGRDRSDELGCQLILCSQNSPIRFQCFASSERPTSREMVGTQPFLALWWNAANLLRLLNFRWLPGVWDCP